MKKLVNGKPVDIKNIELFKKAFECRAMNKKALSKTNATIDTGSQLARLCIRAYNIFEGKLQFPLTDLETDVKYVFIANYIMGEVQELSDSNVAINDCIYIKLEKNTILRLMNHTWSIEPDTGQINSEKSLSVEDYASRLGYDEMKWSFDTIKSGEDMSEFYTTFMPDFVKACKNEPFIMNWELTHILDFGKVPEQIFIEENRIIDIENGYQYFLDVYGKEERKSNEKIYKITVNKSGAKLREDSKLVKVYDFDIYGKAMSAGLLERKLENKIEKRQVDGMAAVFETLLIRGISDDSVEKVKYKGIITHDLIIFEVDNNIYTSTYGEYEGSHLISNNVALYSCEFPKLYMKRSKQLESGVYEDSIFTYDLVDKKARICRISYRA